MATVDRYVNIMRRRYERMARRLGYDIARSDLATRIEYLGMIALIATLARKLEDAGLINEGEFITRMDDTLAVAAQWAERIQPMTEEELAEEARTRDDPPR